jgi:DNA adenine methylase
MKQRPVLRYHGGKFRIRNWIISHFPPHRRYVEPFGGAGSILMTKPRSDFDVYNDLDAAVVNVFRVYRDPVMAKELRRLLRYTPWSRDEFYLSYVPTEDPLERARRTIVRAFMAHGSTSVRAKRTGFRAGSHPDRRGGGFGDWRGYPKAAKRFTERLQGVVIENTDAMALMRRHDRSDTLFYVDPPYPQSTRSAIRCDGDLTRAYNHEMTDDDHRRLRAVVGSLEGTVIVSGYPCSLYDDELYAGWERDTRPARGDGGVARTEVVWIKPAGVTYPSPSTSLVQSSLFPADG